MKSSYIIDIQYFGSIYLFKKFINGDGFAYFTGFLYKKEYQLNRTWIMGANKVLPLCLPLVGGRNCKIPFRDIRLSDAGDWKRIHWRTIHDSYRKAPWYEQYASSLESVFRKKVSFLMEWNLATISWVLEQLPELDVRLTEFYDADVFDGNDPDLLKPVFFPEKNYPSYRQVFCERLGFVGNLSILDLLMNEGPASVSYLMNCLQYEEHKIL